MYTLSLHLTAHADGHYSMALHHTEHPHGTRSLQAEESRPMPEVSPSDAFSVAAQMAAETLRALEPSPSLWRAAGAFRTG